MTPDGKHLYRVTAVLLVEAKSSDEARAAVAFDAPNFVFETPPDFEGGEDVECFAADVLSVAQSDREEDLALVRTARAEEGEDEDDEDDYDEEDEDDDDE